MSWAQGTIVTLDGRGRGLLYSDGQRLRVPGTDVGEQVRVRYEEPSQAGAARLLEARLLVASGARVDPACDQAAHCPGCPLRHLSRARQLEVKVAGLRRALERVQPELSSLVEPPRWSPLADGTRLRSVASALLDGDGQLLLGMRGARSPSLAGASTPTGAGAGGTLPSVDLARCPLHHPQVNAALAAAARELGELGWRPYERDTGAGTLRWVKAQANEVGAPRVSLVTLPGAVRDTEALAATLLSSPPRPGLIWEAPARRGHATASYRPVVLRAPAEVCLTVGAQRLRASPGSWTPGSLPGAELLLEVVLELLERCGTDSLLEIGCGVGSLSIPLAARGASVLGVDASRAAAQDATHNAERAGVGGASFRVGGADRALRRLAAGTRRFDGAILHGMRRPYGRQVLGLVGALGVRRLLCVAPSVGSLARDLRDALDLGWELRRAVPVDQLPHTPHLLTVARLERSQDRRNG